jgi:prepilin peptidase CpaA
VSAGNYVDDLHLYLLVPVIAVFPLAMAYAVVTDVRTLTIPNWTSVVPAALFLPAAMGAGLTWTEIAIHYGIGIGILVAGMVLFAFHLVGGGDVKLLAAAAVWYGWGELLTLLLMVALLGGVLAFVVLFLRTPVGRWLQARYPRIDALIPGGGKVIPYGVAIGISAIFLYPGLPVVPREWLLAILQR